MPISSKDIHWLAGFFDGEGYFGKTKTTIVSSVSQKDEWHIRKVQGLLGGKPSNYPNNKGNKYWRLDYSGHKAAGIMMTLYVLMSPRRQERIRECLDFWRSKGERGSHYRLMTHCRQGHEYTEANTYMKPNAKNKPHRQCRECMKRYYTNRKQKS